MHTCSCACLHVRVRVLADGCIHASVCACADAFACVLNFVHARVYVCVSVHVHVYTCARPFILVCLCVLLCTQVSVHVCVRMCACAGLRACTRALVGVCVYRLCPCIIFDLEILSGLGMHVLRATLLVLKLCCFCILFWILAVEPLAAVQPFENSSLWGIQLTHKENWSKFPENRGLKFCDLKGQGKVTSDCSFRRYIYKKVVSIRPAWSSYRYGGK
jgi:hypothetical protein